MKKQIRDLSNFSKNEFNNDVKKIKLKSLNSYKDVNDLYDFFQNEYLKVIEKHAPLKTLTLNEMRWKQKPWITKGIQKSIKRKDILYRKFLRSKSFFWENRYKLYRNNIKKMIFFSKKRYYANYFAEHELNAKKVWAGINGIIHKKSKNNFDDIFINEKGDITTNQKIVTNKFNQFYTSMADDLVSKLGKTNNKYQDYLKNPNKHSIFFNEIEPDEVLKLLHKLNPSKAADIFYISPKFLKTSAPHIHETLTTIFNFSLKTGTFPDQMKLAKVIPIFKSGSKLQVSNYRPISLLPIFSKIFEKLMYSRLYSFLLKDNILFKGQYGFQKGKSTEHAILDIQSKIVDAFENKAIPCCIFLDFAKAFDTVNHNILLSKLNHYGIRGNALTWFTSYLSNRKQCVQIGNQRSDILPINCGVPQGSVLGPLLFLLYINDISNSSHAVDFQMFADDTCIFYSHKNKHILENTLNTELNQVSHWLIANKLSLNIDKSNALVFRTKNSSNEQILNLHINGQPIIEKQFAKYLGVFFDNKLTWQTHIEHITSKLIKGNALLAKLRHFVPAKSLKNLYNALIQPHINYGILSWGASADVHLKKIEKLQNKAVRIISFKKKEDLAPPLYKSNNILPIKLNHILIQGKFFWKLVHAYQPLSISNLFKDHGAGLSDREFDKQYFKLRNPYQRTSYGTNFLIYNGAKTWNQIIPNSITEITTRLKFNNKLKLFVNNLI